jgi:hypothetical protein
MTLTWKVRRWAIFWPCSGAHRVTVGSQAATLQQLYAPLRVECHVMCRAVTQATGFE